MFLTGGKSPINPPICSLLIYSNSEITLMLDRAKCTFKVHVFVPLIFQDSLILSKKKNRAIQQNKLLSINMPLRKHTLS